MTLMFLLVIVQWHILRGRSFQTVTGKGYQPSVIKLGALELGDVRLLCLFFFVTTILPVGQLPSARSSSSSASTSSTCSRWSTT